MFGSTGILYISFQDTGKYCFGVDDTLKALEMGAVETLICWENLDIQVSELNLIMVCWMEYRIHKYCMRFTHILIKGSSHLAISTLYIDPMTSPDHGRTY